MPHFNVINGGVHAANDLDFQEFMIAPVGAPSVAEGVRAGAETYAALKKLLQQRGHSVGLGDEGGFAPQISGVEDVLGLLVAAITAPATRQDGTGSRSLSTPPPPSSTDDGALPRRRAAPDHGGHDRPGTSSSSPISRSGASRTAWPRTTGTAGTALTERLGERVQLVGDDIFVTNPAIIRDAITRKVANAALIKLNQIGTVTETLEAMAVCRVSGYAADGLPPLGRDRGHLHRRPRHRHRMRSDQVRRAGPR